MAADKFYRNRRHVMDIEPDSLWRQEGDRLVLVDEDEYWEILVKDYPDMFYEVPAPVKPPAGDYRLPTDPT